MIEFLKSPEFFLLLGWILIPSGIGVMLSVYLDRRS